MEIGEFLKEQYKEYYPNLGVFTNNSGKDILVKYEKGDKETIIVKNGDSWTGVDGFWDTEKQQWYKITDNIDVELTPDGGVRWSPGKHATPGGKFEENQMNKKGGYQSDIPKEWPDPRNGDSNNDQNNDGTNSGNGGKNDESGLTPGNPTAPGTTDGNGEPSVPHLDDPPKKRPYNPFVDGLLDGLKGLWDKAKQASSPLILDLDGDGVETLGQDAGVFFDHDANGFAQLSGWVAPDDGLLVWDRNGNGQIDDGSELFGNNSLLENGQKAANGFAALAELDKNGDGVLDANDAAFAALRVWRDKNSDGKVGEGELLTLDELGIQSLGTNYKTQNVTDASGNQHLQVGSFTFTDAAGNTQTYTMTDVWFGEDRARSLPTELVEVPEEIAALPNVMAFGNVYGLHQAMARDESGALRALVEQFGAEADPEKRAAILEQLLYTWVGVATLASQFAVQGSLSADGYAALRLPLAA